MPPGPRPVDGWSLVFRAGSRLYAMPLESVVEVMPVPRYRFVLGAPAFVLGVTVLRGEVAPVVDLSRLVSGEASEPTRAIVLRVGQRLVTVVVEGIDSCVALPGSELRSMPPLLSGADSGAAELRLLDGQLLVVLEAARLLSESLQASLMQGMSA